MVRFVPLALPLAALFAVVTPRTQGLVVEDWTRTLTYLGGNIYGRMIATGPGDSLYVTGHAPGAKIVTARLDAGGAPLWQTTFDHAGTNEHAAWLAVDPFGDVLVAGYHVAGANRTPSGFVTLKYDAAGNLLWSDAIASTFGALARVATDAQGDVVVVGRTFAAVGAGMVTIKYSRSGARLWTRTTGLSSSNQDYVGGLAIDSAGRIFVTGGALGTMLTFAYDSAGNPLWERATPAMGSGSDLALSPNGDVYVAGSASGVQSDRCLVAKYDVGGNALWIRNYPGISGTRIAVDAHGDVVVTGPESPAGGYLDWITHKLDAFGNVRWTRRYDQHRYNDETPRGLAIGPDDEIYVTGSGGPGPASGNLSYVRTVTVRYSRQGVEEWAATSFTSQTGLAVVRLRDGSLATLGESTFTVFHYAQAAVWRSLGDALAGAQGLPHLEGIGSPRRATNVTLELSRGRASAPVWLALGTSRVRLPLLGGVLVPSPDLILGLTLSASGTLSLPLHWPTGVPLGLEVTFQAWIADPAGPAGFAASNALVGVSG